MSAIKNHYFDWINSEAYEIQNLDGKDDDPRGAQYNTPVLSKPVDDIDAEPLPF